MTEPALEFDANGFLIPYVPVTSDFDTVRRVFVEEFPTSTTRQPIFERYQECNARLRQLLPDGFKQWVDGSFVSRKIDPNDIDVLTFIDAARYWQHEETFRALRREFATGAGRVDVRVIQVYPEGNQHRNWYESDYTEWLFIWSQTNTRPRLKKGFIELTIT
ncbi:DUF6932 family protein [Spirosoma areae]